ncbi:MAG: fatty acid cis/trans isomerase [Planctomycetales bacterium]
MHSRSHVLLQIGAAALLVGLVIALALTWTVEEVERNSARWQPFVYDLPTYPSAAGELGQGFYLDNVQPILDRRCIACHGCLDSPCLLKLTSYAGVMRGSIAENPDANHFLAEEPVRLNDAPSLAAWRERGFCAVVDQNAPAEKRASQSVLFRMIAAGTQHNQPGFPLAPIKPVYDKTDEHLCPCSDDVNQYLAQRPAAGMPFGFPGLSQEQLGTLSRWITAGSPGPTDSEMAKKRATANSDVVGRWEAFLNQDDRRTPLVSRYIFEHSFLATLVFEESPGEFFRLVRSVTPSDRPIREIVTARPFDDPLIDGVERFFYRLKKVTSAYVQKSFFVWSLDEQDRSRWDELFYKSAWTTDASLEPGYTIHNPFEVFQAIPARSRSLFLLENSKLIASGMIRGPVCVGNIATYAIKDYYWVFFVDPDSDPSVLDPKLGLKSWNDFMGFEVWQNAKYEEAYAKTLGTYKPEGYAIDDVWDGDKKNPNAWLTILRNETNATVMWGRKGGIPPTFWLIDYSGYERLYYSLVADYIYWGNLEQKLATWEFMGYLRQEFEDNFLRLLPVADRKAYRSKWTKGVGADFLFTMPFPDEDTATAVPDVKVDSISSVLTLLQQRLTTKISGPADLLNTVVKKDVSLDKPIRTEAAWIAAASTLTMRTQQPFIQFLPSVTFVRLKIGDQWKVYTLIANRSYAFNDVFFDENGSRQPMLDTLSIYEGLVGDFPNLIISLTTDQAAGFLSSLQAIGNESESLAWKTKYGTLRNHAEFWSQLDWFTDWNFQHQSPEAGYYDLRYYNLLDSKF